MKINIKPSYINGTLAWLFSRTASLHCCDVFSPEEERERSSLIARQLVAQGRFVCLSTFPPVLYLHAAANQ